MTYIYPLLARCPPVMQLALRAPKVQAGTKELHVAGALLLAAACLRRAC